MEENNITTQQEMQNRQKNNNARLEIENLNEELREGVYDILLNNGEFLAGANRQIFNDLIYYKPIDIYELELIESVDSIFTEKFGKQVVEYINKLVRSFVENTDIVQRINPETREAMEIVNYRNIKLNDDNELIKRSKKLEDELFLSNRKKEMQNEILNDIFSETEELLDIDFKSETEKANSILEKYNFSLEQNKVSKLYLTLGTLKGTLSNVTEKIKVDAPILFVPIHMEFDGVNHFITNDKSRNLIINREIILTNNRLNEKNTKFNDESFSEIKSYAEFSFSQFQDEAIKFYEDNGIKVAENTKNADLAFHQDISIGIFDTFKNPTQIDLTWILENGFITENIAKLFSNKEEFSKMNEITGEKNEEAESIKKELIEKNEYEVSFISKLNFPQDKAIKGSKIHDNIVIQGPPGTGKTETITSIISDAIIRNKKILVSSEKLVALDVIKSRMAELAKFTLLFNRETDSADFYDQLSLMISESVKDKANQANSSLVESDNEILYRRQETRKEIIEYMKDYQTIFQYLKTNEIGQTYSFLYKNHSAHRTVEPAIKNVLKQSTLINIIKQNKLLVPKLYDILYLLNQKFSFKSNVSEFDLDQAVLNKYPFLVTHTKSGISERKVISAITELENSTNETLYIGDDFSNTAIRILRKVFIDVKHLKTYIKSKDEMLNILNAIKNKINNLNQTVDEEQTSDIYNTLGSAWSATFDGIAALLKQNNKKLNPTLISSVIFDHTIQQILLLKESSNTELQRNVSNGNISTFNQMISKGLTEIVERNITLTGRKLRDSLLDVLINSGRMVEIQSIIENQKSHNVNSFMEEYWEEIFEAVNIWLLPADNVPQFFPLVPEMFDIVIIDEASQMQVEKAIPLMFRAKKLIISGDDKQLKPSVDLTKRVYFDKEEYEWNETLMPPAGLQDALKNKFINFLLNYHYRSKYSELISFSNSFFYNKNLYVSTPNTYEPKHPPIEFHKINGAKNVAGKNVQEATKLVKYVNKLIKEDPDRTIGIVTFTNEQKLVIQEKLDSLAANSPELDLFIRTNAMNNGGEDTSLFIKNVSEVQGDERDIMVFSIAFAKSNSGTFPTHLGMVSEQHGENRLNVAVTRAKSKIVVFSSINPNDLDLPKKDIGGNLLKHFLYYAQAFETGNKNVIRRILKLDETPETKVFESRMHEEIFHLIKNAGYNVDYKFGFDSYKIDFVIKNEEGNIILGINLDNEQYLRNFNTMEREYYLPTYLKARGWNLIRIWSHQWSKDPETENGLILERIKTSIDAFNNGSIISVFGSGNQLLDFNGEDDKYASDSIDENIISDGEDLIESRYQSLNELAKRVISEKNLREEQKWMAEYNAMEAKESVMDEDELGLVLDSEFKMDNNSKSIEGIEDPEVEELIRLAEEDEK